MASRSGGRAFGVRTTDHDWGLGECMVDVVLCWIETVVLLARPGRVWGSRKCCLV